MNKFKEYNDTKIPQGEEVIFELLTIKDDPLNKGYKIIPLTLIPPKDLISVNGNLEEIGAVKGMLGDGNYNLINNILFTQENGGKIILTSGNIDHEIIYKFFSWCNFNESNKNRDVTRPAVFREVNPKKEEAARIAKRDNIAKARGYIAMLDDISELEAKYGVYGKDALYDLAERTPEEFIKTPKKEVVKEVVKKDAVEDDHLKILAKAVQRKKVQVNYVNKTVTFDRDVIYTYATHDFDKQALIDYLLGEKPEVLDEIAKSIL